MKKVVFFIFTFLTLTLSAPSYAYYWFSGAYRPVLNYDASTFHVGQNLSRAAGTSGWYGFGGFGFGYGFYRSWGLSPWRSRYFYPRPSYRQYRLAQNNANRLVEIRLQQAESQKQQFALQQNDTIQREERAFENFEKTEGVINRLTPPQEIKQPKESLVSKDKSIAINYY